MAQDLEPLLKRAIEPKWKKWANLAELYLIAFAGGWLAHEINFPAAWLVGSLFAVAIALFAGRKLELPKQLQNTGMLLIGVVLGSGFSPETLDAIATWPVSITILAVTVIAISWAAYAVLHYVGKWDHATAMFASLPGALSYVMAIAEAAKADMQRVAIAQSIRLFVLIAILPVMLTPFSSGEDVSGSVRTSADALAPVGLGPLALLLIGAALLGVIATRMKVPAGLLLAGMFSSGGLYLSGILTAPLPSWFMIFGFITIGALIGCRFGAITFATLLQLAGISLLSLIASVSVSGVAAYICASLLDFPFAQVFLAFSPGGFETMVLLAFLFDLNPAYVAGHHLVRYLGLVIIAPIVTARLIRK